MEGWNWKRAERAVATQEVLPFTGEGAYHGSTKRREVSAPAALPDEVRPSTVERYEVEGRTEIDLFTARFSNRYEPLVQLAVPSQEAIRTEGVTFCWCPFDEAMQQAGPLVHDVLAAMRPHLSGKKRHVYVDAKIQYFEAGDLPVDSQHWHLDGTIVARGGWVAERGFSLLHDLRARVEGASPPVCLSYQSSAHCATRFVIEPVAVQLPELVPDFVGLDAQIRALEPKDVAQPAASIVRFDGLSLHRADPAQAAGWRLWVRVFETDREVQLSTQIIECYGTVFRPGSAGPLALAPARAER